MKHGKTLGFVFVIGLALVLLAPAAAPADGPINYVYYPSANVYLNPANGVYFHMTTGAWQATTALPGGLKLTLGNGVNLALPTPTPYIYNAEHRAKYPPGLAKEKPGKGHGYGRGKAKSKWD